MRVEISVFITGSLFPEKRTAHLEFGPGWLGASEDSILRYKKRINTLLARIPLLYPSLFNHKIMTFSIIFVYAMSGGLFDGCGRLFFPAKDTITSFMVELFPTRIRCTALALTYNAGLAVFGGTAPLICTFLIQQTGDKLSPGYYLIFAGLVSGMLFLGMKETYPRNLRAV